MPTTEPVAPLPYGGALLGTDKVKGQDSFARETVLVRLPKILQATLADNEGVYPEEVLAKLGEIAAGLAKADEDGHVRAILDDGGEDTEAWNAHLRSLGLGLLLFGRYKARLRSPRSLPAAPWHSGSTRSTAVPCRPCIHCIQRAAQRQASSSIDRRIRVLQ